MPVHDPVFAELPAPQDFPLVQAAVEIHEPEIKAFEFAADLLQLAEEAVDLGRDGIDLSFETDLVLRFPPLGAGLCGDQLILRDKILPLGIDAHDVLHDALHEGKRTVRFGESKELVCHSSPPRSPAPLRGAV